VEQIDKQFYETKEKERAARKISNPARKNSFNTFEQTDMSDKLDEMEKLFLEEINS
jgi:hypothetical protein